MSVPVVALARKEVRALLPVWAATAGTIAAEPWIRGTSLHSLFPLGPFAYVVGSLALGAHVIGHEYSNRTLGSLLAQPCRRSSILLTKTIVLAAMLMGLVPLAWPLLFAAPRRTFADVSLSAALLLPFAGGLFVAPYVTMRLRSQIAGVVFTAAIPGVTYTLTLLIGVILYGVRSNAPEALAAAVWPPAMVIAAGLGAVLSVRTFLRLQDIEGGREELSLPRWLTAADRNPIRPPLWMLVKKELRLQQMTFAMPVLFGGIWAAVTLAGRLNPDFGRDFPFPAVALLYFALLPLLIGSLASAQERQFGTLESQAMLPVPFAQQWAIKAGVVLALAVALGVLFPWFVFAPPQVSRDGFWVLAVGILLLTAWSLYLSSWSPSGIIALTLVLPATAAAIVAARWIDSSIESFSHTLSQKPIDALTFAALAAPLVVALVLFAGRNHRTRERGVKPLATQAVWLLLIFAAADALLTRFM